ncbi:hypothetical protein ACFL7E_05750 [Thermodesulfobacteriota bacterium]
MNQKTQFVLYTILFAMLFLTVAVYAQAPPAAQAKGLSEATFYVH